MPMAGNKATTPRRRGASGLVLRLDGRSIIEQMVERMIEMLDVADGDPDLEETADHEPDSSDANPDEEMAGAGRGQAEARFQAAYAHHMRFGEAFQANAIMQGRRGRG